MNPAYANANIHVHDLTSPAPSPHGDTFDSRLASIQPHHHSPKPSYASSSNLPPSSPTSLRPPVTPSHPGCVLCSLVASASGRDASPFQSPNITVALLPNETGSTSDRYPQPFEPGPSASTPRSPSRTINAGGKEVVYQDTQITVYRADGKERLCSGGNHLIVVINQHVENVYDLGPSDVPLLSHIIDTSHRLLTSSSPTGQSSSTVSEAERGKGKGKENDFRVGILGSVMRDPQSPHKHLHAHAMIGPIDTSLPGATFWRRNMVFGSMNWWGVDDLRAEIREESSNNRVKSGYQHRDRPPIDRVPDAGSVAGLPNALEPQSYKDESPPASLRRHRSQPRQERTSVMSSSSLAPPSVSATSSKGKEPERNEGNRGNEQREEDAEAEYEAVDLGESAEPEKKVDRGGRI